MIMNTMVNNEWGKYILLDILSKNFYTKSTNSIEQHA